MRQERCACCDRSTSNIAAAAIAVVGHRQIAYVLCKRCAEYAKLDPAAMAEAVEEALRVREGQP